MRTLVIWNKRKALTLIAVTAAILGTIFAPAVSATASAGRSDSPKTYYDSLYSPGKHASNYVLGAKWNKSPVTYGFSDCPHSLNCATAWQVVREAVEAWDAVCGLALVEVQANPDIAIGWYKGAHGDGNPFDGPGGVLAHAFFPGDGIGGDVHFDDDETWVATPPKTKFQVDLKTTALHELGHALGLDHSQDPTALMWDEYNGVRAIGPDDIAGIQALYGPPSPDEATLNPGAGSSAPTAVSTTTVRVRSGPGTNYDQVGTLAANTTVTILGKNAAGDWIYLDADGLRGWAAVWLFRVNGSLSDVPVVDASGNGATPPEATPTAPPPSGPTPAPPANPGDVTGVAMTTLRVRSGPGTNYPSLGAIDIGTAVTIVGRTASNSWVLINFQGTQGWVATWLLQITGDLNSVPVIAPRLTLWPASTDPMLTGVSPMSKPI